MDSTVSSTFFFKNGSTAKFGTGSLTFEDGLNSVTVMIANDTLLKSMADYLTKQNADTIARFMAFVYADSAAKSKTTRKAKASEVKA